MHEMSEKEEIIRIIREKSEQPEVDRKSYIKKAFDDLGWQADNTEKNGTYITARRRE